MLLFLNADRRKDTGWEGYDFLVNWPVLDGSRTTVKRHRGGPPAGLSGWDWEDVGEARYRVEGNQLMIAVPRGLLGLADRPVAFDFHWADNVQRVGAIEEFFLSGDSAPSRRFDYRYG
jgi:hypothetical protein